LQLGEEVVVVVELVAEEEVLLGLLELHAPGHFLSDAYAVKMEEARCRGWNQLNLVVPDADRGQVLEVDGDGAEGERCERLSEIKPGWETIGRPALGPAAAG
jgi:hypothetical protein